MRAPRTLTRGNYVRLEVEPHDPPNPRKIAEAVAMLHDGAVAAYPTDSVYALGCAIDAHNATKRIYQAKQMSERQRLALLCPDLSSAAEYAHFSQVAYRLARRVLPGPYTLVLPATREVPRLLMDKKRRTVGIRISAHPITRALVQKLGRPLLTTSAIAPGQDAACADADEVIEAFGPHLDLVIDGGYTNNDPSTVLEVDNDEITVLREGGGPIDDIFE